MSFIRLKSFRTSKHGLSQTQLPLFLFLTVVFLSAIEAHGGVLEIRISDHREAIADFEHLFLSIDSMRISRKAGLKFWQIGWIELQPSVKQIDLPNYIGDKFATVFRGTVPSGSFDAIDLRLKQIRGSLKSGDDATIKNLIGPIEMRFSVPSKGEAVVVLDLVVLDMSDHPSRGYELMIKGYEVYKNGKLIDKIPPG